MRTSRREESAGVTAHGPPTRSARVTPRDGPTNDEPANDGPRERDERTIPADLGAVEAGDILCDRHRQECFQVLEIDSAGISLRQGEHTYYVPHSLFVPWYGSRLFPIAETTSTDRPGWCTDGESR